MTNELIPVFRPNYGQEEIDAVSEVIKSGWIGLGPKTEEFEKKFAEYVGAPYAIALNSATAALHLSLLVAGVGEGDEVIVPSLTFVSTAHAAKYVEATPIFVDVEKDTLNISLEDVVNKITKKTKAIIPVHYGGQPYDMDGLQEIADKHNLTIIEDAAHACGSVYKGKKIGNISEFTCFSFHAVKNLATGDGGMITVKDQKTAERLRRLRWVGINKNTWDRLEEIVEGDQKSYRAYGWHYEIEELGYKCHMNDLNAALGLAQLKKLDAANQRRRELGARYTEKLHMIPNIVCPAIKGDVVTTQLYYVIRCKERDQLHLFLREKNISSGVHFMPIHLQPYYRRLYPDVVLPVIEEEWKKFLTLPLYPDLTNEQQDFIISSIQGFYKK